MRSEESSPCTSSPPSRTISRAVEFRTSASTSIHAIRQRDGSAAAAARCADEASHAFRTSSRRHGTSQPDANTSTDARTRSLARSEVVFRASSRCSRSSPETMTHVLRKAVRWPVLRSADAHNDTRRCESRSRISPDLRGDV